MKRVPGLLDEPPCLAMWRAANPGDEQAAGATAWKRFKDERNCYEVLLAALVARQQGLCGYCEQRVTKADGRLENFDYQVEHVEPKSRRRALDWQNLMLCCGGGTWAHHEDPTRFRPPQGGKSCGEHKGASELDPQCDPRSLPWRQPIVTVELDGFMRADVDACREADIDPNVLQDAIDHLLELNCERLRMARGSVARQTSKWVVDVFEEALRLSPNLSEAEALSISELLVGGRLRPDRNGHLCRFWTTERQYLGPLAEAWIRTHAELFYFEP
jgi:uncharacterized protein (TIGR02646 family)